MRLARAGATLTLSGMRSYGHLWLFVFLGLIGFDGPGPDAVDPGHRPSDSREADRPVLVASAIALPTSQWTPAGDRHPGSAPTTIFVAFAPAPSSGSLRSRERDGLNIRRPFAETVSYRSTAPPLRIA